MKTAIQEIIDKYYQSSIYRCEFTEWLIENKELLLEKEKEQIINAFMCDGTFTNVFEAEQYYNKTYNQNK